MATVAERLAVGSNALRAAEFPVTREYTYLNAAAAGPMPERTRRAVAEAAIIGQFPNTARVLAVPAPWDVARPRLAALIGAEEANLAPTSNTTHGMNIVAHGIDWRPGDNAVIPEREYPALSYAWHHMHERGVEVRFVPFAGIGPTTDEIMAAVDSRTRVVALSAIRWDTGWRVNLEELGERCAAAGCLLAVDGVQLVGARRVDVGACRIAAMTTHAYKWLMAGFGAGALYVAPEATEQITPTFAANSSFAGNPQGYEGDLPWQPGAARYVAGGLTRLPWAAVAASLSLIEEIGVETVEAHGAELAAQLRAGLARKAGVDVVSSDDPAHASAITVFTTGSTAGDAALTAHLDTQGIIVALRPLGLRVSPHLYNTPEDVARLLAALPS